jgi:opacity protein-like surface antigen
MAGRLRGRHGTVSVDDRKPWGIAAGVDIEYGLTDAWALRASFEGSTRRHEKQRHGHAAGGNDLDERGAARHDLHVRRASLVPYAELQAGIVQLRGAVTTPQTLLGMELGVGADYFVSRRFRPGGASTTCSNRPTCFRTR